MKPIILALACLLLVVPAAAGPVVLTGDGSLYTWTSRDVTGGPFWANPSYDRNGRANVGYYLAGIAGSDVPGFLTGSPGEYAPYLGVGATTFLWDLGGQPIQRLQGVTGWPQDALHLAPWGDTGLFAFAFETPAGWWWSNELDQGRSHYAAFRGTDAWYIGLEDATWTTTWRGADWDYNDLILRIPDAPVPEGGSTLLLLGAVLLGVVAWGRR